MKILVTGGAGYIGSHIVNKLVMSHEVAVFDNLSTGFQNSFSEKAKFYKGDVRSGADLQAAFSDFKPQAVIHMAAKLSVPESIERPIDYYDNNVGGVIVLLQACRDFSVKKLIFSSTAAVYGNSDSSGFYSEESKTEPLNPYGFSKLFSEQIIADAVNNFSLQAAVLRYFNVSGAAIDGTNGQRTHDCTQLVKRAAEVACGQRDSISVFGNDYNTPDGTCIRDYIHVEDLADIHIQALEYLDKNPAHNYEIFNCGYGKGYSVLEIIESMKKVSAVDFKVNIEARRAGDAGKTVADNSKLKKNFTKWSPRFDSLDTICSSSFKWEIKKKKPLAFMQTGDIRAVELKYDLQSIKLGGESIWPVLRIYYFYKLRDRENLKSENKKTLFFKRAKQRIKSLHRGLYHFFWSMLFFRKGVLVFSDSYELREIAGKAQNKIFLGLFNKVPANKFLYFEKPADDKFFYLPCGNPKPISTGLIDLAAVLIKPFVTFEEIENEELLNSVERDLEINLNYKSLLKILAAYRTIARMLLRLYRPQAVFLTEYYNLFHMAVCYESQKAGIKCVEFQHGIINKEHVAYNFYGKKISSHFLPSYFAGFGSKFLAALGQSFFIDQECFVVSGHSYISWLKDKARDEGDGRQKKVNVLVTLQWTDQKKVILFINEVADACKEAVFILLPRVWDSSIHNEAELTENVFYERDADFYRLLKNTDVHVTTYSTTALEAASFDVPNILLNFDDMAKKYFKDFIPESDGDIYVNNEAEFVAAYQRIVANKNKISGRSILEDENLDALLNLVKIK